MSIHAALTHRTAYTYNKLIGMGPQIVRLRPAPHSRTQVLSYSLKITPEQHFLNWQQDAFGNFLARIVIPEKTEEFSITVDLVADMAVINPFDFFLEETANECPFVYGELERQELAPYLKCDPLSQRLEAYIEKFKLKEKRNTIDFIVELNQHVHHDIKYLIRMEAGVQTPEQTL